MWRRATRARLHRCSEYRLEPFTDTSPNSGDCAPVTIPRMRLSRRASSDLWISSTPYAARQAHNSAGCNEQDGPGFRDRSGSVFKGPNPGYSGEAFVTHPPTDPRLTCPSNENLKSSLVLTSRPDIEALTTNGKLNVAAEMGSMGGRDCGGAEKTA